MPASMKLLIQEHDSGYLPFYTIHLNRIHAYTSQGENRKRTISSKALLSGFRSQDQKKILVQALLARALYTKSGKMMHFQNVGQLQTRLQYYVDDLWLDTAFCESNGGSDDENEVIEYEMLALETTVSNNTVEQESDGYSNTKTIIDESSKEKGEEEEDHDDQYSPSLLVNERSEEENDDDDGTESLINEDSEEEDDDDDTYEPVLKRSSKRATSKINLKRQRPVESNSDMDSDDEPLVKKRQRVKLEVARSITATSRPLHRTVQGRKQPVWSAAENAALAIAVEDIHKHQHVRDMKLFDRVSARLASLNGIRRSGTACKNQWNRYGRAASRYDERMRGNKAVMQTSMQT